MLHILDGGVGGVYCTLNGRQLFSRGKAACRFKLNVEFSLNRIMYNREVKGRDVRELGMMYLERLRLIHVNTLNRHTLTRVSAVEMVDALKQLAELLIWGAKSDFDGLFEYFCEENIMEFLTIELPCTPVRIVRIQLLQTMSMLIHNVENERMRYYMLSNNYMNALITHHNMYTGGDVSSWTVSLLKTLSGVVNSTTIKFFYQEGNTSFPLLEEALRFLSSSDSMKRAHVMNIALNILRLNDPSVTQYVVRKSRILTQLTLYLRYSWRRLNRNIKNVNMESIGQAESILLTQCDDVFQFLMDIMDLGIQEINEVLLQRLFTLCFFPLIGSILRNLDTDASLIDAIDVPAVPQCSFYRSTYQKLMIQNGLVGIYASYKSELFGGNHSPTDLEEDHTRTLGASNAKDDKDSPTASPTPTPRSIAEFQNLNIPATILANELLPTVSYYLLVMHLSSVRREDVRRYILLLTHCPFAPRNILEEIRQLTPLRQLSYNSAVTDDSGDENAGDGEVDATTASVFDSMKAWERHVFGQNSFQRELSCNSDCDAGGTQVEYVLNLVMGEFLKVAICDLPRCDSRISMLLAMVHSLQNSFMKLAPNPESADDFPFEQFMAVPITTNGLHVVSQVLNAVARQLSSPTLRIQALNLALCIIRNSADIVRRYDPRELHSFLEEVKFHLEVAYNNLTMLINSELEQCAPHHVVIFYDEWLRMEAVPSRRVDILEYPQLLLGPEKYDPFLRQTTHNDLPRSQSAVSVKGDVGDHSQTPSTTDNVEVKTDVDETLMNAGITNRTPMGLWLFGNHGPSSSTVDTGEPPLDEKIATVQQQKSTSRTDDSWGVLLERMTLFRRHIQAALLVRSVLQELESWDLMVDSITVPRKARLDIGFNQCPLLQDQQLAINGTPIVLGAHFTLENVHKYPCIMIVNSERKRRYVVCSDAFFLLMRRTQEPGTFETT
ncbi:Protein CLEC16A -like protein [Babesia sp. Xinjiang]|uniref:Protein CLEC16A -like protein n=1 Tax=Babesia sp. Xinjiang TaxID=462227 RepID=UPI000A21CD32|nr:Protein CLEC16A -like protein [Babesia sp. Xinjiang]XP_028871425.1 Protein CLEC16A -like protein [Babesia sp. Xinjiang]ORM40886.1 Protein CLEC16A -like protein [Babesia sp. Xinjiang]ORM40969.1 Protein CLEC16A -like protein [Babesia sp. Xinjiang]